MPPLLRASTAYFLRLQILALRLCRICPAVCIGCRLTSPGKNFFPDKQDSPATRQLYERTTAARSRGVKSANGATQQLRCFFFCEKVVTHNIKNFGHSPAVERLSQKIFEILWSTLLRRSVSF